MNQIEKPNDTHLFLWTRGISCDIQSLPIAGPELAINFRPSSDPSLLRYDELLPDWNLCLGRVKVEDPSVSVVMNQENLRRRSSKRIGASLKYGLNPHTSLSKEKSLLLKTLEKIEPESKPVKMVSSVDDIDAQLSIRLLNDIEAGNDISVQTELLHLKAEDKAYYSKSVRRMPERNSSLEALNQEIIPYGEQDSSQKEMKDLSSQLESYDSSLIEVPNLNSKGRSEIPSDSILPKNNFSSLDDVLKDDFGEDVSKLDYGFGATYDHFVTEIEEANADERTQSHQPELQLEKGNFPLVNLDNKRPAKLSVEVRDSKYEDIDSLLDMDIITQPSFRNKSPLKSVGNNISWADTSYLDESEFESFRPWMALKFDYELDSFQKQAVMRLERKECVFVAAHTSAGKTAVAEYAIALARKHMTRAIYTSPIKALSNQKYRDFSRKFDDTGLVTGDVSVNPDASCLIMTTEILRSMLYRGADTIRDIEWVIFDEVHYVNDLERGVVWEEVIIMLPDRINLIFLSATTPNTIEFSDWIGRTKGRKVYVTSSPKRPVPLQHYLLHDDDVFKVLTESGAFKPSALNSAKARAKEKTKRKEITGENAKMQQQRAKEKLYLASQRNGKATSSGVKQATSKSVYVSSSSVIGGSKTQWLNLLRLLRVGGREESRGHSQIDFGLGFNQKLLSTKAREEKSHFDGYDSLPAFFREKVTRKEYYSTDVRGSDDENENTFGGLLPVVIFSFSKRKCEEVADFFSAQDLLIEREKWEVGKQISQVLKLLNPLDRKLPQVLRLAEMLRRGIGLHHGGLLPILKETVEILFARGTIKVLLATETFAMGVNMPARCVVFNGTRKHDGKEFRELLPGEYTQMAGRAGRRGLDKVGTVIVAAWNDLPQEISLRKMLIGTANKLSSQFYLSYLMILNLLRANDLSVEDMITRSFSEFHTQRLLSDQDLKLKLRRCVSACSVLEDKLEEMVRENVDEFTQPGEVKYLHDCFYRCRSLMSLQIDYIKRCGKPNDLPLIFCEGRVGLVHNRSLPFPCVGLILRRPIEVAGRPQTHDTNRHRVEFNDSDLAVWVAVILPVTFSCPESARVEIREDTARSGSNMTRGRSSDSGFSWTETRGATSTGNKYWVTKVPINHFGILLTKKIKLAPSSSAFTLDHLEPLLDSVHSLLFTQTCTLHKLEALDFTKELKVNEYQFVERQLEILTKALPVLSSPILGLGQTWELFDVAFKIRSLESKVSFVKHYISNENLTLFPDFQQRLVVLRQMGYLENGTDVVTLKGRVACEMNTGSELLTTEIVFKNILEPLNPPEAAAILSALVFQEKNEEETMLTSRMEVARAQMFSTLNALNDLQSLVGIDVSRLESDKPTMNFGLSSVVYEWARGVSFKEITSMTSTSEGTVVRCITRLDELCKDIRNAARVIGNPSLYRKMEAASLCFKRDICFQTSLYV
jgi:antiviral helicase SKI2